MVTPTTADARMLVAPRRLERHSFAMPDIGDNDGLLRVEACGLCGTDHEQYTGTLPAGFAFVPGHESVGIVEAIGDGAARRWGVSVGDRVAVEVFQSCRRCDPCRAGNYQRCERHGLADMYGFIDAETAPGLWGGYAQYQYLAPDTMLVPIPHGMDPVLATIFNPLGAGIRWGVTLPQTRAGDIVAVLGPGIRGISACAAAKDAGAAFVMVTGLGEGDAPRLRAALEFGADLAVDVSVDNPVHAIRAAVGRGADVVVDVTAKAPAALGQAVALARPGGTVVLAGTRGSSETPGFHPDHIVYKELRMIGALGVDTPAYRAALDLIASDRYPFAELSRRIADLNSVEALIQSMAGEGEPPPIHGVVVP